MTYIVTGFYGSGKTEFCLNLALRLAQQGQGRGRITIADLDVVNPFFRSREKEQAFAGLNIDIVGSAIENHIAQDVPAISFGFLSRIRAGEDVILDLAGGESGIRLLANCYDAIAMGAHQFLCVFNAFRPETATAQQMQDFIQEINTASKLQITGLVNNGNLLASTTVEHVLHSQNQILQVGLPLEYTLVREDIRADFASREVITFAKPQMREGWQG